MILRHHTFGQTARFERYTADLLWFIAAGKRIDPDRTVRFRDLVDRVFTPPEKEEKPMTAAEVKAHIVSKIDDLLAGG